MKNGIVINGIAYDAVVGRFNNRSYACKVCAFGENCFLWTSGPCAPFDYNAGQSESVYFVRHKRKGNGKEK